MTKALLPVPRPLWTYLNISKTKASLPFPRPLWTYLNIFYLPKHFQNNSIITFHCTSVDLPIITFPRQKHHYLSLGPCGLAPSFHDKGVIDSNAADYVALFLENGEALVITLNHQLCSAIMYTYIIVIHSLGTAPSSPCLFNNPLIRSLHLCINLKCKSPSPSTSSLFPLLYT